MILYKYLHPDRIDVLKNRAIRFSPPIAFNDPFEFKPVISSIASDEYVNAYVAENLESLVESELSKVPEDVLNLIPRSKVQEFAVSYFKNNPLLFSFLMNKAKEQLSTILSEKPDNLLMWSHYAESHRGYCIGFNSNHSFFNRKRSEKDEFYHLRKVKYLAHRPSKSLVDMNGTDIFLLKSNAWEYEQEWRMCAVLPDADTTINFTAAPAVHLFKFPADAIEEIIVGVNADSSLTESIKNIIDRTEFSHVKVKQASVSEKEFTLCFIDL